MMMEGNKNFLTLVKCFKCGQRVEGGWGGLMTHTFGITETQPSVRRGQMAN